MEAESRDAAEPLSGGAAKVAEYAARVAAGEDLGAIVAGLPPGMRSAVEAAAAAAAPAAPGADVPPQYAGLPADVLEDIWTVPVYVDPEKTKFERERKATAVAAARQREAAALRREADEERVGDLRAELGLPGDQAPRLGADAFSSFKLGHGKTGESAGGDAFWWWSYENEEAKRLKGEGTFQWGQSRLYFDAPFGELVRLRDLALAVAAREKVALAFKFLDQGKTAPGNVDGAETRFVANFASPEEAARFYRALAADPSYAAIVPDRQLDYQGLRLDPLAEYASGYREGRGALQRILAGSRNAAGEWEWLDESGQARRMAYDESMLEGYRRQSQAMEAKIAAAERAFRS